MALLFPSIFDHPTHIRFAEQETDEKIELFLRQHWITNVPWILFTFFAFFVPVISLQIDIFLGFNFSFLVPSTFLIAAVVLWYLLVLAYVFEKFLSWYFNIYIVTNQHVVDINFNSILSREVLEAGVENVESASSKIKGVIRSLFNYGDVVVQTAAENQQITFLAVPRPDMVADRINDLRGAISRK